MAEYNTKTISKTIDDDGIVTIDMVNDGIQQSDGSTIVPNVIVSVNGTDPTTPMRAIRWTTSGQDYYVEGSSMTAMMRCEDGAPFVVAHQDDNGETIDPRWVCFVGDVEHDMLITARHVTVMWCNNGANGNRVNAWVEIPAP